MEEATRLFHGVFERRPAMNIENATTAALLIAAVTLLCAIIYCATGANL